MYITLPLQCPAHIFKLIPRWSTTCTQIYTHIPNHCCVPISVIPKTQMIPVFLWHVGNDTGEKINKLTTTPRSTKLQSSFSKQESDFQNKLLSLCRQRTVTPLVQAGNRKKEWAEVVHEHIKNLGWGEIVSEALEMHETA